MMRKLFFVIYCSVLLTSCSEKNNIDNIVSEKWEKCDNHVDCVVDFATSMQFQWDTMYFFSGANSKEDIEKELRLTYDQWEDVGDKVIFLNKGNIVYQQDWFLNPDKLVDGTVFLTDLKMFKIDKSSSKFRISKKSKVFYLQKM